MATSNKGKGKTVWVIAGVAGAALISIVVAWHFLIPSKSKTTKKKDTTPTPAPPNSGVYTAPAPSGGGYASGYPLKNGSRGDNVKSLQQALVRLGHPLVVDGIMGSKTTAALTAQTGSSSVESPSDLQALVDQSWANNSQGSMLAAPPSADNTISYYDASVGYDPTNPYNTN